MRYLWHSFQLGSRSESVSPNRSDEAKKSHGPNFDNHILCFRCNRPGHTWSECTEYFDIYGDSLLDKPKSYCKPIVRVISEVSDSTPSTNSGFKGTNCLKKDM